VLIVASIFVARGIRIGLLREWGVSTVKGLLWKEGVVFGAAPAVEVLQPLRDSDREGLVLLGCRGGTRFPLIFLPTTMHLN